MATVSGPRPPYGRAVVGPLAVVLILAGVFAAGLGLSQVTIDVPLWTALTQKKPPPSEFPVLGRSRPVRIVIPTIGVKASVHEVGLADDGTIAVPPLEKADEAGWFDKGPTPGQNGPAIVVGHVDTRTGPAVFNRLDRLLPGERIEITRRDRRVAIFEVNSVEHFDKSHLPTERIYTDFSRPGLRLITCGGRWIGGPTGYEDSVVVFASLVRTRRL